MRELHWHPNANEWQYYIRVKGRMTLFHNQGCMARTIDFRAGDVGYVPQTLGHYIENTGDTDLVFLEMFKAPRITRIFHSTTGWRTFRPNWSSEHLGISQQTLGAIPKANLAVLPA